MTTTTVQLAAVFATQLGLNPSQTAAITAALIDWDPTTPSDVAALVTSFTNGAATRDASYNAWWTGSATGGPGGDGLYPISVFGGGSVLLPCPAKLALTSFANVTSALGYTPLSKSGDTATGPISIAPAAAASGAANFFSVKPSDYGAGKAGLFVVKGGGGSQNWNIQVADTAGVTGTLTLAAGSILNLSATSVQANGAAVLTASGAQTVSGGVTATSFALDANFYAYLSGSNPVINFDGGDYISFGRSVNTFYVVLGSAVAYTASPNLFAPGPDNGVALGATTSRWTQLYAATSTISTSDARAKTWRGELTAAELRVARRCAGLIGVYRWNEAVVEKGDDARLHVGVLAQKVRDAFRAEELDGRDYGLLCYDAWGARKGRPAVEAVVDPDTNEIVTPAEPGEPPRKAGDRWGVRYEELLAFVIAGQEQRLTAAGL